MMPLCQMPLLKAIFFHHQEFAEYMLRVSMMFAAWCQQTGVLVPQHGRADPSDPEYFVLGAEASAAARHGHLLFYVLHNVLAGRDPETLSKHAELAGAISGSPGEKCGNAATANNWTACRGLLELLLCPAPTRSILRGPKGARASHHHPVIAAIQNFTDGLLAGQPLDDAVVVQLCESVRAAVEISEASSLQASASDRNSPVEHQSPTSARDAIDADISRARDRHRARQERALREEEVRRRREEQSSQVHKAMTAGLLEGTDALRFRGPLNTGLPLSRLRDFHQRGTVLLCLDIVRDLLEAVVDGSAYRDLEVKYHARQRAKEIISERKVAARRLMDVAAGSIHVPPSVDHRSAVAMRDLVYDIVRDATRDDIVDELLSREKERNRQREIVSNLHRRFEHERQQRGGEESLPLRIRMEREKERQKVEEEEQARRDKAKFDAMRQHNRDRSEQASERQKDELAAKAAEEQAAAATRQALERSRQQYLAQAKLSVLTSKLERLIVTEGEARSALVALWSSQCSSRDAKWSRDLDTLQHSGASKQSPPALIAEEKNTPPLTLSLGTGRPAAYLGDSFGEQFMTQQEAALLEVWQAVRQRPSAPSAAVSWLRNLQRRATGKLLSWPDRNNDFQPMHVTGLDAFSDVIQFLSKCRPCKPETTAARIGLTLAARQHAIDLAFHGIAHSAAHLGTDGQSTALQRIARYGTYRGGQQYAEAIFGVVRPHSLELGITDVMALFLLDDGDDTKASRRMLLASGDTYRNVGIGHAIAWLRPPPAEVEQDAASRTNYTLVGMPAKGGGTASRSMSASSTTAIPTASLTNVPYCVEVFVVLAAAEYKDATPNEMAEAHYAGVKSRAPTFFEAGGVASAASDKVRSVDDRLTIRDLFVAPNVTIGRLTQLPSTRHLMLPPLRVTATARPSEAPLAAGAPHGRAQADLPNPAVTKSTAPRQRQQLPPVAPPSRLAADPSATAPSPPAHRTAGGPETKLKPATQLPKTVQFAPQRSTDPPPQPHVPRTPVVSRVAWCVARWRAKTRRLIAQRRGAALAAVSERHYAAAAIAQWRRRVLARRLALASPAQRGVEEALDVIAAMRMRRNLLDRKWDHAAERVERHSAASLVQRMYRQQRLKATTRFSTLDRKICRPILMEIFDQAWSTATAATTARQLTERILAFAAEKQWTDGGSDLTDGAVKAMLTKYGGRERTLLSTLVAKYGAEENWIRKTRESFAALSFSEAKARSCLAAEAGREDVMLSGLSRLKQRCAAFVRMWAARARRLSTVRARELAAVQSEQMTAARKLQRFVRSRISLIRRRFCAGRYRRRLIRFYKRYNPDKLPSVDEVLVKYKGLEEDLFQALVNKYGPEPDV